MLYTAYESYNTLLAPTRASAALTADMIRSAPGLVGRPLRRVGAWNEVLSSARLTHVRPDFEITSVATPDGEVTVHEEVALATPFARLVHFRKDTASPGPAMLLVAPLSGHFATMLRATVRALLADHDVYVTDWRNARDVPVEMGGFGLDDYTEHLIRFIRFIGPGSHVMAVCQPCGPALAATSILAQDDDAAQPLTLTLMSGPIDARVNPTKINELAQRRTVDWYRKRCITTVPRRWQGAGRRVYPGFLQVSAFMSMNAKRHVSSHVGMYKKYAADDVEGAEITRDFYREYFAVLDIAEEFYLDNVDAVFQRHLLAVGELEYGGRLVEPAAIRKTALMTIEAERDDLCAPGQTEAAHGLTTGLRAAQRARRLQAGVGHYGIFAGRRWEGEVYPAVRDFVAKHG